jgi:alpha-1,6-mannosyltransferase
MRPRPLSSDLAVAGMVASVAAVAAVAGMNGSPLSPVLLEGAGPYPPFSGLAGGLGLDTFSRNWAAATAVVVMLAAIGAFLFVLREAWQRNLGVRLVLWISIAFVVVSSALPVLLSRDVYSYTIYGRIASVHHANPYVAVPNDFRSDPVFPVVGPEWRDTRAVYGPAFTMLSAGITRLVPSIAADTWAFKVVGGLAAIGLLVLIARVAGRLWPGRSAFAVAVVGCNPVFLFHAVGGGHNDVLVGLSVAGALAVLTGEASSGGPSRAGGAGERSVGPGVTRELVAAGLLTLGALVKAPAAIALVLLVAWAVWRRPRGRRLRILAAHALVVGGLVVAFAAPFFQMDDPTLGLSTLASHVGWLSPTRLFRVALGDATRGLFGAEAAAAVQTVVRVAFAATFLVVFVALARRTIRAASGGSHGPAGAQEQAATWGWALLLFALLSPVLLPWYAVWVLPLAWLLPGAPLAGLVFLSAALAASQPLAEAADYPGFFGAILLIGRYVLAPMLFLVLVWLLVDLVRRLRAGDPLAGGLPPVSPRADERQHVAGHPDGRGHRAGARTSEPQAEPVGEHSGED